MKYNIELFLLSITLLYSTLSLAADKDQLLKTYAGEWIESQQVISAIEASNQVHLNLQKSDIDKMDAEWKTEVEKGGGTLTKSILDTPLSQWLRDKKQSFNGKVTEIFITDNKGLNVAQSDMTSDYWQGDEPKFQQSYGAEGNNGVHLSDVEFDESTQTYQVQLSRAVVDKAGHKIGAVTMGIIVDK